MLESNQSQIEETIMNHQPLWESKKAVAAVLGIIITGLSDTLNLDAAELTQVLTPLAAYLFGQGLADLGKNKIPKGERKAEKAFWLSKKFQASLVGVVFALLNNYGVDTPADHAEAVDIVSQVVGLIAGYVGVQGVADMGKNAKLID